MQDRAPGKGNSPPKAVRVEEGKIRKIRGINKSESPAIQHFNGKTYACESCKRGHRVHKCDHGKTRPISETNQPGRPSGGQKRGCQCPRNCACSSKTCKCERDCACTQEMFLIVRVDAPRIISRDATSSPKPVWEDANGNKMTLKKVWADANGKEIDDEEYRQRKRRMKQREEGVAATPEPTTSSCCGSKIIKEDPDSPPSSSAGCRHRSTLTAIDHATNSHKINPAQLADKAGHEPWRAACSCGSGCSCLYCPDHPNNAISINHTQQQVKHMAEHGYNGGDDLTAMPFLPTSSSRSCMGGRPSFFLSRTPDFSQQLQEFFPQSVDPNAIYLTYPIQQHSWTNQPTSPHCSQIQSPSGIAMTPESNEPYLESLNDLSSQATPWELLPSDANGTWNFSDGNLGDTSFSWVDFDASQGRDYSIGQATVASSTTGDATLLVPSAPATQLMSSVSLPRGPMPPPSFLDPNSTQFDAQNVVLNIDHPTIPVSTSPIFPGREDSGDGGILGNTDAFGGLSTHASGMSHPQIFHPDDANRHVEFRDVSQDVSQWSFPAPFKDGQIERDVAGTLISNSPPITNRV